MIVNLLVYKPLLPKAIVFHILGTAQTKSMFTDMSTVKYAITIPAGVPYDQLLPSAVFKVSTLSLEIEMHHQQPS